MVANEKETTSLCNKLRELPPVVTEWQQPVWCLDCDYYSHGHCSNPIRRDGNAACPFDGQELPLRQVLLEAPNDQLRRPLDVGRCGAQLSQPRFEALEQAIKLRVKDRTGGRIQALAIELTDGELVVRGTAPCYYVKQLVLHAALDVLRSACEIAVHLKLDVEVLPPTARPGLGSRMTPGGSREEWQ